MSRPTRFWLALGAVVLTACGLATSAAARPSEAHRATSGWKWVASEKVKGYDPTESGGLSCPTTHLCVAAADNKVAWSTNPTKASSWHHVALEPLHDPYLEGGTVGVNTIDCPSAHFCATADNLGQVWTTTKPTAGKASWHAAEVDDDTVAEIDTIACANANVCVAGAYTGAAFTYSHGVWRGTQLVKQQGQGWDSSCPTTTLCAMVAYDHDIYTTNPSAGSASTPPTWRHTRVGHVRGDWSAVACWSGSRCTAAGDYDFPGAIGVSTNPAGGHWKTALFTHAGDFYLLRCHTGKLCFAVGDGHDYYSTSARASTHAWHAVSTPDTFSQVELSCPSTTMCIVGAVDGRLHIGRRR